MKEFDFIMSSSEDLTPGTWVAVVGEDVIEGENSKEVYDKVTKKYPNTEPFVMKVPDNANMLL